MLIFAPHIAVADKFPPRLDPRGSSPAEPLGCDHQQRLGTHGTMSHYQRCHQGFDDIAGSEYTLCNMQPRPGTMSWCRTAQSHGVVDDFIQWNDPNLP